MLTATELLVLQLLTLGYAPKQIAPLVDVEPHDIGRIAQDAAARCGTAEWREAAAALVRRGMLSESAARARRTSAAR